ncbi:MAG TPA: thioesterase family protein [Beijerinckiaceae bacterium]|nr:thioesterase family protein [Beijerinckiaceae bacterium]
MTTSRPERPVRVGRAAFRRFIPVATRWADNDVYGHVNNVQYYAYFDTAVNQALIEAGLLDIEQSRVVGLVVETSCTYFESLRFPDRIEIGLAMERLGGSSLTYRIGVFKADAPLCAAVGRFVHVYVDRATQRPVPLTDALRTYAEGLVVA